MATRRSPPHSQCVNQIQLEHEFNKNELLFHTPFYGHRTVDEVLQFWERTLNNSFPMFSAVHYSPSINNAEQTWNDVGVIFNIKHSVFVHAMFQSEDRFFNPYGYYDNKFPSLLPWKYSEDLKPTDSNFQSALSRLKLLPVDGSSWVNTNYSTALQDIHNFNFGDASKMISKIKKEQAHEIVFSSSKDAIRGVYFIGTPSPYRVSKLSKLASALGVSIYQLVTNSNKYELMAAPDTAAR